MVSHSWILKALNLVQVETNSRDLLQKTGTSGEQFHSLTQRN